MKSLGFALLILAASPAAAGDPPFRMQEVTPDSNHVGVSSRGMWGYADATGEYALVADGSALRVVDVSDPARPVHAARVRGIGYDLREVKTYKHYAYCVNQGGPLLIVDLADPYHAYIAATFSSPRIPGARNIWITDDGYAYVALKGAGRGDLRILDLTADPLRPVERGSFDLSSQGGLSQCHDVYVRNDTCFASWFGDGLVILDVKDKDRPVLLLHITYPDQATHNAWPTVDGRFVCTTDERSGGHLRIWDIEGHDISPAGEYAAAPSAVIHNVHLKGPLAVIAYYTAGVRVVDLGDPRRPREVGAFDTSARDGEAFSGCWSVYPYAPSGLIYAADMQAGLFLLRYVDARDGTVRGTIRVHGAEAARVEGAEVRFLGSGVRAVTDRTGYYEAKLYGGAHTARVSRAGFRSESFAVAVEAGGVVTSTLVLDPLAGGVEFAAEPGAPALLPDGRLVFEARVRARGKPVAAVTLRYRSGGAGGFRGVDMAPVAADDEIYRAHVPDQLSGTLLQYFIEARDAGGRSAFAPEGAPAVLMSQLVGEIDWTPVLATDFETGAGGFTVGSPEDWGVRGIWERVVPVVIPIDSLQFGDRPPQPHFDTTPTGPGFCFLTELGSEGAHPYDHELTGRTTLTSPEFDLRGAPAARLRCALWYNNDFGGSLWQDPFLIEGSSDGGTSWRVLDSYRLVEHGWHEVTVDLGRRLEFSGAMRVRFVAMDEISPTFVEAALDDLRIEATTGLKVRELSGGHEVARLRQNAPNPFNPATLITYQLKEARPVRLAVYDAGGHLVRTLVDGVDPVGDHAVSWDGRDVRGFAAPSGVYVYRLDAGEFTQSRKMLLIK